jgi:hypothetical protein
MENVVSILGGTVFPPSQNLRGRAVAELIEENFSSTRVSRVVSGVTPETCGWSRLLCFSNTGGFLSADAIRRDAELNPPEAGATSERAKLKWWAQKYVDNGGYCLKHKINVGGPV